jgi:hypothetical protein
MNCLQPIVDGPLAGGDARPATIWATLATEYQERVVRLLAQLACTLATTSATPAKESTHGSLSRHH